MTGDLTNHLWQSTLFAFVVGLLSAALRENRAHVRYWLWFAASLKFFIPFSLLVSAGSLLTWTATESEITVSAARTVSLAIAKVAPGFPDSHPQPLHLRPLRERHC